MLVHGFIGAQELPVLGEFSPAMLWCLLILCWPSGLRWSSDGFQMLRGHWNSQLDTWNGIHVVNPKPYTLPKSSLLVDTKPSLKGRYVYDFGFVFKTRLSLPNTSAHITLEKRLPMAHAIPYFSIDLQFVHTCCHKSGHMPNFEPMSLFFGLSFPY